MEAIPGKVIPEPEEPQTPPQAGGTPNHPTHPHAGKSALLLFLWLWGNVVFMECELRLLTGVSFWGPGLVFIALFSAVPALAMTAICCLFPRKVSIVLSMVFMGLQCAFYIVEMFYYFVFNTFLTTFSLLNGGDAMGFGDTIQAVLLQIWPYIAILLIPSILFTIFGRKMTRERSLKGAAITAALAVLIQLFATGCLYTFGTGYFTPYDYYYRNHSLNQSVDKLGLVTTIRLDVQRYFLGEDSVKPIVEAPAPAAESAPPQPTAAPQPTATPGAGETPIAAATAEPVVYGYNVMDIDFAALAVATDDSTLKSMHQYFGGVAPTQQNEYTGMFEGYNLITVTAESFAPYAISEELTPTLYKMARGGFEFTNFYCPEWPVSTSDGEYVNCLGLIPKPGVWSLYMQGRNENLLPFALGHQFGGLGYQTYAYHNNSYTYYDRDVSHPAMGYTFIGVGNGLEIEQTWPQSDLEMVDATTADYLNGRPFHTYYMTVSGHMEYNWGGNDMAAKHRGLVEDLPLSDACKAYIACNIELDRAMELLLRRLEEAGVADKTVIAISPDHPPYGLDKDQVSELLGHTVEPNFEYYESTLILYNPAMEHQVIDDPCTAMDILPTLSNLFGLEYDSRLLMGRDVLSGSDPLAFFGDRSWITRRASFNSGTGEAVSLTGDPIDQAYVDGINQIVADKFTYSPLMLDTDYYRVVLEE